MSKTYNSAEICNALVVCAKERSLTLSLMRLQNCLYLFDGYCYYLEGDNHGIQIEYFAHHFGIAVPEISHIYCGYTDAIHMSDTNIDPKKGDHLYQLIESFLNVYGQMPDTDLVGLIRQTHPYMMAMSEGESLNRIRPSEFKSFFIRTGELSREMYKEQRAESPEERESHE